MASISAHENASTSPTAPARPIPERREQLSPEERDAEWEQPWRVAARVVRVEEALARLEREEQQQDLTIEERSIRLHPFLQALWRAEDACVHPADKRFGERVLCDLEGVAKRLFPCPELDD